MRGRAAPPHPEIYQVPPPGVCWLKVCPQNFTFVFEASLLGQKFIYAATLYIVEFVSSAWDRTSLVKMSRCRINDQHMSWHFMATLPWQFMDIPKG